MNFKTGNIQENNLTKNFKNNERYFNETSLGLATFLK